MLEFLADMGQYQLIIVLVIFIVFIFIMKRVVKTIINMIWITLISAAFPIAMNSLFGFDIPINLNTILFFIAFGLGVYGVYILAKIIYSVLGIFERSAKVVTYPMTAHSKSKKEKMEKDMEKFLKEKKELEKEAVKEDKKAGKEGK